MEAALAEARLVVNETICTVGTKHDQRLDGTGAGVVWHRVSDHDGFILAVRPGIFGDQSSHAPAPIPVGSD